MVVTSCECIMLFIQAVKSIIGEVFDDVSFEEFEEDGNVSQRLLCRNSYKPIHTQWKVVSLEEGGWLSSMRNTPILGGAGGILPRKFSEHVHVLRLNLEASWNIMTLELTVLSQASAKIKGGWLHERGACMVQLSLCKYPSQM